MKAAYFALITCVLSACPAHAQFNSGSAPSMSVRDVSEASAAVSASPTLKNGKSLQTAPLQQFECNGGFSLEECNRDVPPLKEALDKYKAANLGDWTWVLVRSENWKHILLVQGLPPEVPAITVLGSRTTFFDEALVSGPAGRVSELMDMWHLARGALLDLAVRHELGHAFCNDPDERSAVRVAELLEKSKPVSCDRSRNPGHHPRGH